MVICSATSTDTGWTEVLCLRNVYNRIHKIGYGYMICDIKTKGQKGKWRTATVLQQKWIPQGGRMPTCSKMSETRLV